HREDLHLYPIAKGISLITIVGPIPAARRAGGASLLLALLAVLIFFLGARAASALQYDRTAVLAGQWYRLLTAHLTHWNADHLFWDVMMFAGLGFVCEQHDARGFYITVGASALLVTLSVLIFCPAMHSYCGLS